MVVNAGIVSPVRELLLDISDSLMLWLTSVILKVIFNPAKRNVSLLQNEM